MGGLDAAASALRKFGFFGSPIPSTANAVDMKNYFSAFVRPAVIKFEMTLLLLRGSRADTVTVRELDTARKTLITAARCDDMSPYAVFRYCRLSVSSWIKLV